MLYSKSNQHVTPFPQRYHLPEHLDIYVYRWDYNYKIKSSYSFPLPLHAVYFAVTIVYFIRPSHDNTTIILFSQTDEVFFLLLPHRKLQRNIAHELSSCCEQRRLNLCLRYSDVKK